MLNNKREAEWYKQEPTDKIWWLDDDRDEIVFSFDRVQKFYLFSAYPDELTKEQKDIFDKENPRWKAFFEGRMKDAWGKDTEEEA